jgi:L-ribulose-5-phosphate 4-epimerase
MIEELKQRVFRLLLMLPTQKLVVSTGGNVSARDEKSGFVIIKPSGVPYEQLRETDLVVVDSSGNKIEGNLKPSSDTLSHLYIYKHMPEIMGIVHTHSPYATAFASAEMPIPVIFSEMAEEFDGEIPVTDFVLVGDDAIGEQVVKFGEKTKAVLLRRHGVFTMGKTPEKAVDLAILAENAAHTAWLSMMLKPPVQLDKATIDALYYRQQNIYGQ